MRRFTSKTGKSSQHFLVDLLSSLARDSLSPREKICTTNMKLCKLPCTRREAARVERTNPVKESEPSFFFLLWLTVKGLQPYLYTDRRRSEKTALWRKAHYMHLLCVHIKWRQEACYISELDKERDLFLLFSIIVPSPVFSYNGPCIRRI